MAQYTLPDAPLPVRVLVVDDEPQILRALRATLRGHGYDVHTVQDGEEALDEIATHPPDIVILDLVMPGKSGFEVVREVRQWSSLPIIVLSARGGERDKVTALDLGADDYLTKPFGADELLARLRVALRHRLHTAPALLTLAGGSDVTVNFGYRTVTRAGERVHLTPTEWKLLLELTRNAGKVLTQRMLLVAVWGPQFADEAQYLRVYINQLRRKLEANPARPRVILTEPGVGYRFVVEAERTPPPAPPP